MINKLFLSVGAMKSGTTWLQRQFIDHPEVFFTPEKEIHYFYDPDGKNGTLSRERRIQRFKRVVSNMPEDLINDRVRKNLSWYAFRYLADEVSPRWYKSLFSKCQKHQYAADFSNLYCLLTDEQWNVAESICKDIRVVYTLRHPLNRLWSHIKFQNLYGGREPLNASASVNAWKELMNAPGIRGHGDYDYILPRLIDRFDQNRLLILFFEDVRSDPAAAIHQIESFLEIKHRKYSDQRLNMVVNPTEKSEAPKNLRKAALGHHIYQAEAMTRLGLQIPKSWLL